MMGGLSPWSTVMRGIYGFCGTSESKHAETVQLKGGRGHFLEDLMQLQAGDRSSTAWFFVISIWWHGLKAGETTLSGIPEINLCELVPSIGDSIVKRAL